MTREWYLRAALEHGWSQNVLVHMVSGKLHEREGKALTNFQRTLPPQGSDMAEQILRDPGPDGLRADDFRSFLGAMLECTGPAWDGP